MPAVRPRGIRLETSGITEPPVAGATPPESAPPPARIPLFSIPPTPGIWLGFAGIALFLVATFLPWYSISARFPGTAFNDWAVIIQFDGLNGLYVHPQVKAQLGLGVPAIGFPLVILFILSIIVKIRKLLKSTTHKARSASLFRASLAILIPVVVTLALISQFNLFIPAGAPPEVKDLGQAIASQPFGGERPFTLKDDLGVSHTGNLRWGFGPALWVMIAAAALLNVGSQFEKRVARKAHAALLAKQQAR